MKQSNFKESRLKEFKKKFVKTKPESNGICNYSSYKYINGEVKDLKQFLSETIDMAEKEGRRQMIIKMRKVFDKEFDFNDKVKNINETITNLSKKI